MTAPAGYVTELEYIPGFYPHMAPIEISYCAQLHGVRHPDPAKKYRYLELGCGLGRVCMTLAAANPDSEFVAVDFNKDHIQRANEEIAESGLTNVTAIAADIRNLPATLGTFDYITVHGVLSWVPTPVQDAILKIGQTHLADNGLLLVSYNALPGWAPIMPLRELMLEYTRRDANAPLTQIAEAVNYLKYIKDDAAYFKHNPIVGEHLKNIVSADPRYLVHEYLNDCWTPFYFTDVHDRFAENGMAFVGSLPLPKNYTSLVAPDKLRQLLEETTNRRTMEAHRDYFMNTQFRWDIYTSKFNQPPHSTPTTPQLPGNLYYKSKNKRQQAAVVKIGDATVALDSDRHQRLLSILDSEKNLSEIVAAAVDFDPEDARALGELVSFGVVSLQKDRRLPSDLPPSPGRYRVVSRFNRVVCARDAFNGRGTALASTITGSGVSVPDIEVGFLWALATHGEDKILDRVADELEARKRELLRHNRPLTSRKDIVYTLSALYQKFKETTLAKLIACGVVEVVRNPQEKE